MAINTPRLSVCMIVRDSSRTLPACLQSIAPWVDEMIVVDTGSLDDTAAIAERLGARVFDFPWCDHFSAARNESLRHATGEWMLWMDSDDTIDAVNGAKLRALADQEHDPAIAGFVMQVKCPGPAGLDDQDITVVDHVKLIRNHRGLQFEGRIHEQILPAVRRINGHVAWTDLFVVHSGVDHSPAGQERKRNRDLKLLHRELEEQPDHPFTLFNLGMTYTDMEQYEEAAGYLARGIEVSSKGSTHLAKAYSLLVYDYKMLGRWDDAWHKCVEGMQLFPDNAELQFRSGVLLQEKGRNREAVAAYRRAMTTDDSQQFKSYDAAIKGFKARQNLAIVYAEMGELALAELQWREIVREKPNYSPGWQGLGENLVKQKKLHTALILADSLDDESKHASEATLIRFQIKEAQGDIVGACVVLRARMLIEPEDYEVLAALCRVSFVHGPPEETERLLINLLGLRPDDAAAFHNLGSLYMKMGRHEEAVACLSESTQLRPDSAETWLNRGSVLHACGRIPEAIDSIERAFKIAPGHIGAASLLEQLRTISIATVVS